MGLRDVCRIFSFLAMICCLLLVSTSGARSDDNGKTTTSNLGVQDYEVAGVQVILLSVKRTSDGYLTLKWAYHNTTNSPQTIGQNTGAMSGAWSAPFSLAWDVYVTADAKQYKVADAPSGKLAAVHSGNTKTVVVGPKQTYTTWAKVNAIPSDVTKVTVVIQGVAPIEDVPVS